MPSRGEGKQPMGMERTAEDFEHLDPPGVAPSRPVPPLPVPPLPVSARSTSASTRSASAGPASPAPAGAGPASAGQANAGQASPGQASPGPGIPGPADPGRPPSGPPFTTARLRPALIRTRLIRGRRARLVAFGLGLTLLGTLWVLVLPVPFLDGYLSGMVTGRIAQQLSCPGSTAPAPQVTVKGGRVLPQLLRGRLTEVDVTIPDTTVGGAPHATVLAALQGITGLSAATPRADRLDAATTIGYTNLPAPPDGTPVSFSRAPDGSLLLKVTASGEQAKKVKATLSLKLRLQGESIIAVPQDLQLFGSTLKAGSVSQLTGGARTQPLPHLPNGLHYTSVTVQPDGLHVSLSGITTTPLSTLPTTVGGRAVTYQAGNNQLGISTAFNVLSLFNVPLTIFTAPQLNGNVLTLVPQSVQILGKNRPTTDTIARVVLSQVNQADLTRKLPALPAGVQYKGVSVDGTGIKVAVGGTTVRPLSQLPPLGNGLQATFGARDGLLTATTQGMSAGAAALPITLIATPRIVGHTLDLSPQRIELLGATFPASAVLAQIKAPPTTHPLPALPASLAYTGVDVLPSALRIRVSGTNVPLGKGLPGAPSCGPAAAP